MYDERTTWLQKQAGLAAYLDPWIRILSVNIVAEPIFLSGHALRFEVAWVYKAVAGRQLTIAWNEPRKTRWVVSDLSSPMAGLAMAYWCMRQRVGLGDSSSSSTNLEPQTLPPPQPDLGILLCAPERGQHVLTALFGLQGRLIEVAEMMQRLKQLEKEILALPKAVAVAAAAALPDVDNMYLQDDLQILPTPTPSINDERTVLQVQLQSQSQSSPAARPLVFTMRFKSPSGRKSSCHGRSFWELRPKLVRQKTTPRSSLFLGGEGQEQGQEQGQQPRASQSQATAEWDLDGWQGLARCKQIANPYPYFLRDRQAGALQHARLADEPWPPRALRRRAPVPEQLRL
jgi:hypothetical protein